jgi:hypothetical protein
MPFILKKIKLLTKNIAKKKYIKKIHVVPFT